MSGQNGNLEDFLGAILRGAAKILGCNSTNLILINENTHEVRVHVGTTAEAYPVLADIEQVLGGSFSDRLALPVRKAEDSLAYQAWRDRKIYETSSLVELAGSAFDPAVASELMGLVGPRRFICVPAAHGRRNYGVLVFDKNGRHPFSRQQREVLLRYARCIGEIIESSLMGRGQKVLAQWRSPQPDATLDGELLRLTLGDPAPTVFVDTSGRVTSCNAAAERLFGWGAELRGQDLPALFRAPREVQGLFAEQVQDPLAPGRERLVTARRHGGALFAAHLTALALADAKDRVVGFMVLVREANEEDAMAERPDLRDRLASMGEMAAQLAHEIRNPLVAIGATLESLGREEEMGDEPRALLGSLVKEIARLDMVLKGYMAGRLADLSFAEVRLAQVVEDARRLLDAGHRLAGKTVRVDVDPHLTVRADYDALKQVFFNLLLNALEASPAGGEVVCHAAAGAHDVAVSVEDRGPGLHAPPAQCFRPFFTTKKNGTGLGLAVCQKLSRAHGGLVELRNRAGGGCEAVVVLPRGAASTSAGAGA
ncbi:MAG TPA: ATP-binding protein [Myxococcota bacterium]|jgi:PAS domain S-box-containing protein|nr:ATP-binding protein [Myxococcota bacterium]